MLEDEAIEFGSGALPRLGTAGFQVVRKAGDQVGEGGGGWTGDLRDNTDPTGRQERKVGSGAVIAAEPADHGLALITADIPTGGPAEAIEYAEPLRGVAGLIGDQAMTPLHCGGGKYPASVDLAVTHLHQRPARQVVHGREVSTCGVHGGIGLLELRRDEAPIGAKFVRHGDATGVDP